MAPLGSAPRAAITRSRSRHRPRPTDRPVLPPIPSCLPDHRKAPQSGAFLLSRRGSLEVGCVLCTVCGSVGSLRVEDQNPSWLMMLRHVCSSGHPSVGGTVSSGRMLTPFNCSTGVAAISALRRSTASWKTLSRSCPGSA